MLRTISTRIVKGCLRNLGVWLIKISGVHRINLRTPPSYERPDRNEKVIFVAGPMKGSKPGWQMEAAELIHELDPAIVVASPAKADGITDDDNFELKDQVQWEAHWLARAARHGSQLYWFAHQDREVPRSDNEFVRPYAKTTGKELFLWWGRKAVLPEIKLVLGAEPSVTSLNYEKELAGWMLPKLPDIQTELTAVCNLAVELAHQSRPIDNFPYWTPESPLR